MQAGEGAGDQAMLGCRGGESLWLVASHAAHPDEVGADGAQGGAEIVVADRGIQFGIQSRDEGVVRIPALVACDLLGQAEHDPASGQLCVCLDETFAHAVLREIERQLVTLPTREIAAQSWHSHGKLYVAADEAEAIRLSDDYAPEHLELHVRNPDDYVAQLRNYGSLFIGEETTVAYGDKSIGTNHILPTSRSARYTGGVWVGKFLKTVTYQRMTPAASREVGAVTARQCDVERMHAHAITARVRVDRYREPASTTPQPSRS